MEAGGIDTDPSRPRARSGGGRSIDVGIELCCWEQGTGPAILLLHETATSAEVWRPLARVLGTDVRTIAYDRRGWGGSGAPEPYLRTTIEEQAADAARLCKELGAEPVVVCGAGLGAVVGLELLLRRPGLVCAAALIEPPLLAFLPDATEGLSTDREAVEQAIREGGLPAALDLYMRGGLPFIGPGADRIPAAVSATATARPLSLFAEIAAVPGWSIRGAELVAVEAPSRVVVGASTPPLLRRAAEALCGRLSGAELLVLGGEGLPHVGAAAELAAHLRALP